MQLWSLLQHCIVGSCSVILSILLVQYTRSEMQSLLSLLCMCYLIYCCNCSVYTMRYGGWNSILINDEINTNSLPVHVRSYISYLNGEFRGALCLAEKWLKHEINHSLPSIVRRRICPVLPSVGVQSAPSCTGDQQRVYIQLPLKIYNNVSKASFHMSYKTVHLTKRWVSALPHHTFAPTFRRIITLPSSGWMNLAQVNADVIGSRRYIDHREVLRNMAAQSYRK